VNDEGPPPVAVVQLTGLALVESRCRLADEPRGSSGGGKLNRHFFDLLVAGNELTVARGHGQHQPAILESAPKFARMFETARTFFTGEWMNSH
jgi:hypothetical protein